MSLEFSFSLSLSLFLSSSLPLFPPPFYLPSFPLNPRLDNVPIDSYDNLGVIPIEILEQGSQAIAQYFLDLYCSPESEALFRSKIFTVGFENVGKTTLLDCLLPLQASFSTKGGILSRNVSRFLFLQGPFLYQYESLEAKEAGAEAELELDLRSGKWALESSTEGNKFQISLIPQEKRLSLKAFKFSTSDQQVFDQWLVRLKRSLHNSATHGIDVQQVKVSHPEVKEKLKGRSDHLEISVWDFAGQHEYYNSHYYFLSKRTVFLVLWRMDKGKEGLKSLEFWLQSLAAYLPPISYRSKEYSIMVVGTFLDSDLVSKEPSQKAEREREIHALSKKCGLLPSVQCFEVSCSTLENIPHLKEKIFKAILSHSYMNERLPKSYRVVEEVVERLGRELKDREFPMVSLQDLLSRCSSQLALNEEVLKQAVHLLSLWGKCVYFPNFPSLSSTVFLRPSFLTKQVLGAFFNPASKAYHQKGIIKHQDLRMIWTDLQHLSEEDFWDQAERLMALMEKFEVCFPFPPTEHLPFRGRSSLVTFFLPLRKDSDHQKLLREQQVWPQDPPYDRAIQIEKSLFFNVLPISLVSRVLMYLYPYVQEDLLWFDSVVLFDPKENTQGRISISVEDNSLITSLRGPSREKCESLMGLLINKVNKAARNYPGMVFKEAVRSPFSSGAMIPLEEVQKESALPKEQRKLCCPDTLFPLCPEALLSTSGHKRKDFQRNSFLPSLPSSLPPFLPPFLPSIFSIFFSFRPSIFFPFSFLPSSI